MKRITYLGFVLSIVFFTKIEAQDIHFSQFYASPLNLNPALTGVMNCSQRGVVNYRNQWAGTQGANAYNTFSASYDKKIPVARYDYFGVGGSLWGDVAGATNFGTFQARLSGSYSKYMGGGRRNSHYLVVGADAAMTNRRVNTDDLRWPSQHDGSGGYDPTETGGQTITNTSFFYPDVSAGLLWFSVLNQKHNYYAGVAMHHLNQANVSFLGEDVSLYTKLTAHAGGEFEFSPGVSVLPGFVALFQGPHTQFNGGTSVKFKLGNRFSSQYFQVGLWARVGTADDSGLQSDAVIISSIFDYQNYSFGLSYDWTTSNNRPEGGINGSFELSITYLMCGDESRGVYCPTF